MSVKVLLWSRGSFSGSYLIKSSTVWRKVKQKELPVPPSDKNLFRSVLLRWHHTEYTQPWNQRSKAAFEPAAGRLQKSNTSLTEHMDRRVPGSTPRLGLWTWWNQTYNPLNHRQDRASLWTRVCQFQILKTYFNRSKVESLWSVYKHIFRPMLIKHTVKEMKTDSFHAFISWSTSSPRATAWEPLFSTVSPTSCHSPARTGIEPDVEPQLSYLGSSSSSCCFLLTHTEPLSLCDWDSLSAPCLSSSVHSWVTDTLGLSVTQCRSLSVQLSLSDSRHSGSHSGIKDNPPVAAVR